LAVADDDEKGSVVPTPRIKIKIESLSDLVFGLALSIGSLILIGRAPQSGHDLEVNVLLFGFSFLIIVLTWLGYSRTMSVLRDETSLGLFANLVLLFFVALEPYLFYVLQSVQPSGLLDAASVAEGLDLAGLFLMQAVLAYLVVRQGGAGSVSGQRIHPSVVARFRRTVRLDVIVAAILAVSTLPFFWVNTPFDYVRFIMWYATFAVYFVGRSVSRFGR
jgi:uncharacterized membrane protein